MAVSISSFGFRHGLTVNGEDLAPAHASKLRQPYQVMIGSNGPLIVDVRRILPKNPYHNKKLRALRGDHPDVIAELEITTDLEKVYSELLLVVKQHWGPVYIGCTGGHHRSVYIANRLGSDLGLDVEHLNYSTP